MVLLKVSDVHSLKRVCTEAGCEKIPGMQPFTAEVYFRFKDCKTRRKIFHAHVCVLTSSSFPQIPAAEIM